MKIYFTVSHLGKTINIESDTIEDAKDLKSKLRANGITCNPGFMHSSFSIMTEADEYRASLILSLLPA